MMRSEPTRAARVRSRINPAVITSSGVLLALLVVHFTTASGGLSQYSIATLSDQAAVLAIAAVGTTFVVAAGGFDLSVGSVISLVNVVVATHLGESSASQVGAVALGLAVGGGAGLINGLLVSVARLASVIATLAMLFVWNGVALLILPSPGGAVPFTFTDRLTSFVFGIPMSLVLISGSLLVWYLLRSTRWGTAAFAVGDDIVAARAAALPTRRTMILAYVWAGIFYAVAGILLTAHIGSGDPNVGTPMLLTVYTAIILGSGTLRGGRGSALGSVVGALILRTVFNVLFSIGVSSYYANIVTGVILVAAVGVGSIRSVFADRRAAAAVRPGRLQPEKAD